MKSQDIFHSALLRLVAVYLIIIMVISLIFSIGLYRVSSQELEQSIRRPLTTQERRAFGANRPSDIADIIQQREDEYQDAQSRLRGRLFVINAFIFVAGGAVSYVLAKRTLQPIQDAHEAQSRFTADASHELRTPITAMRVETELTLTEPKLTIAAAKKQLASNIEELDKLTAITEGLLTLARLGTGTIEPENVSVKHLIDQAVERVQKTTFAKKQTIQKTKLTDANVRVHQQSIVEALVTVLDNASKYSPDKSNITISTDESKSSVSIHIHDEGIGIKASQLPHIFDRFYQADSSRTKSDTNGYGVGLSIAHAAVSANNGTISVKSKPGKGSTFTISIPR